MIEIIKIVKLAKYIYLTKLIQQIYFFNQGHTQSPLKVKDSCALSAFSRA